MSWFDSSFTFAKSALSQAQKSIDKVLDIKENEANTEEACDGPHSVSVPPSKSTTPEGKVTPSPAKTAPVHSISKSSSTTKQQHSKSSQKLNVSSKQNPPEIVSTPESKKNISTSSLSSSTWGGSNSFWSSPFPNSSPKKKDENHKQVSKSSSNLTPVAKETAGKVPSSKSAESVISKSTPLVKKTGKTPSLQGKGKLDVPTMTSTPVAATAKPGNAKNKVTPSRQREGPTSDLSREDSEALPSDYSTDKHRNEDTLSPILNSKVKTDDLHSALQRDLIDGTERENDMSVTLSGDVDGNSGPNAVDHVVADSVEGKRMAVAEAGRVDDVSDVVEGISTTAVGIEGVEILTEREEHVGKLDSEVSTGGEGVVSGADTREMKKCDEGHREEEKSEMMVEVDLMSPVFSPQSPETEQETKADNDMPTNVSSTSDVNTVTFPKPEVTSNTVSSPPPSAVTGSTDRSNSRNSVSDTSLEVHVIEEKGDTTQQNSPPASSSDVPQSSISEEVLQLRKELLHSQHVIEVREQKIVSMSHEMAALMETNQTLQGELGMAKEAGHSSVEELREEFTKRIGMSEKKLQAITRERDSLKKQLTALSNEQTQQKRTEGEESNKLLKEKDEQIAQLMEEGEKLSKQELQSNSIIKKLRQKERQNDQLLAAQRQQIEDFENKVKNLKEQLKKRDENEKKYQESLAQLNTIAEQQAKELNSLKTERDASLEKMRSLQANLDNAYKELADLQKTNAVTQSVAQEAAATAERSKQEELKVVLEQQKAAYLKEKEGLVMQIEELRMSVSRAEQQLAWKEDYMKQEVMDIQKRLQEAEDRNQELTATISQATKPLLRQIENLQTAHSTQSANWEKVETSLTQRLVDAQAQLNLAVERERTAVEKEMRLQSRVNALETQLSGIRQEKSQLLATVELERAKLETLEEGHHRDSAKLEALRASYQQSMDELRKEKEMLERQLEYERVRVEAESRKACLESQEKERLRSQLANSLSSINHTVSRQSSSGSQGDILEKSLQRSESGRRESVSEYSLHGSTHSTAGSASALERLQSLLKQREGELTNTQNLASSLERSRAAMAEDLAKLSSENEQLSQQVDKIPFLQQELQEVQKKYEAMLQMYGEKAEEAEELKLDIQDLKVMYRQQIDELVSGRR